MSLFSFHQHLPNTPTTSMHAWALVISMYDRLVAHGIAATLYQAPRGHTPELVLQSGMTWVGPEGPLDHAFADTVELKSTSRDTVINAASWRRLDPTELIHTVEHCKAEVALAIDGAILALKRQPERLNCASTQLESRLLAAREAGYDIHTIYYHETPKKNKTSLMEHGFDFTKKQAGTRDPDMPDGAFFKPTPEPIDICPDPTQIPFLLKKGKVKTFKDREDIIATHHQTPALLELRAQLNALDHAKGQEADALIKSLSSDPKNPEIKQQFDTMMTDWKQQVEHLAIGMRHELSEALKNDGVRFVRVLNDKGSLGRTVVATIALYPEDICGAELCYLPKLRPQPSPTVEAMPTVPPRRLAEDAARPSIRR